MKKILPFCFIAGVIFVSLWFCLAKESSTEPLVGAKREVNGFKSTEKKSLLTWFGEGGGKNPEQSHFFQEDWKVEVQKGEAPQGSTFRSSAQAIIKTNGVEEELQEVQGGLFPRVLMEPQKTAQVRVRFPDAEKGELIIVEAQDGGRTDQGSFLKKATVDENLEIAFDFTTNQDPGIYRVTLRRGAELKTMQFWVGRELTGPVNPR